MHNTPAHHAGEDNAVLAAHQEVYSRARAAHPRRWSGAMRNRSPMGAVTLYPERHAVIDTAIVGQDKQATNA